MVSQFALSTDGTRIAYDRCGTGPALMLLHGGGGSRLDWHNGGYIARVKDDFSVISVDLRGHGESDKPTIPARYSTENLGQDLLSVADACGIGGFILCGYSLGGNVGRYLAARSGRVTKLIMIGNSLGPGVSGEWRQLAIDFRARWEPIVYAHTGIFTPQLLSAKDQEDIQQLSFPGEWVPSILAMSTAMLNWPAVEPIDIRCPALWLFGSENKIALDSYKQYTGPLTGTGFQVQILEGLSHSEEIEAVDQVIAAISAFTRQDNSPYEAPGYMQGMH